MAEVKVARWQLVLSLDNGITLLASRKIITTEALALVEIHAVSADLLSVTYDIVIAALTTSLLVLRDSGLLMLRNLQVEASSPDNNEAAMFMKKQSNVYHPDTGIKVLR